MQPESADKSGGEKENNSNTSQLPINEREGSGNRNVNKKPASKLTNQS